MRRRPLFSVNAVRALAGCLVAAPLLGPFDAAQAASRNAAAMITFQTQRASVAPPPPAAGAALEFIPLAHLFFEHDKLALSARSQQTLDDAALFIKRTPGISRVLIDGHADDTDSVTYNYSLSDLRAEAARNYLVARGVDRELLRFSGFSELRPTDENWTRPGRGRNRRVEIYVVRHTTQVTSYK